MALPAADEALQLQHVQEDLLREFPTVPERVVALQVQQMMQTLVTAPVRKYIPVLVGRGARAHLRRMV
ncbi:MAG: hypothetical protein M3P04_05025 [Actinomycetota bacterium]|nr:hypothetical protein [Actinomycetota bacterium]